MVKNDAPFIKRNRYALVGIISAVVILDTTNNLLVMVEGFWIITLNHDTNIAVFSEITKRIT